MSVNPRTKRTVGWVAAGVVGAVAVGAAALSQVGIAAADNASAQPSATAPVPGGPGGPGGWGHGPGDGRGGPGGPGEAAEMTAVAKVLGLTPAELRTQLMAGKSLTTIAKAKGIALQTVIDTIVTQEKAELAAGVKAGRLTQAQADQMSKDLVTRATDEANRVPGVRGPGDGRGGPGGWGHGPGGPGGPGEAAEMTEVAKVLGLTPAELRTQLMAGKSLATIAKAKGIALQTVIDTIVTQEKAELAAGVKAGRLTQAQADQMSKDLVTRATDEANRVPGVRGPGDGRGGPGGWGGPAGGGPSGGGPSGGGPAAPAPSGTTA